eukprot:gene4114-7400_t
MSAPSDSYVSMPLRSQKSTSPRSHTYTKLKATELMIATGNSILKGLNSLPTDKLDKTSLQKYKQFVSIVEQYKAMMELTDAWYQTSKDLSKIESSMGERLKDLSTTIPLNSTLKNKSDVLGTNLRSLAKLRKANIETVKLNLYEVIGNFFQDVSLVKIKDHELIKEEMFYQEKKMLVHNTNLIEKLEAFELEFFTDAQKIFSDVSETPLDTPESSELDTPSPVVNRRVQIFGGSVYDGFEPLPPIIEKLILYIEAKYLDEQGILFENGEATAMKRLQEAIEKQTPFYKIVEMDLEKRQFTMCGVLKKYIRDLPDTLLTSELYPKFVEIGSKPSFLLIFRTLEILNEKDRVPQLKELINELPLRNREVIARWMRFFERILVHKLNNKLNPTKLAMTLGINLSRQDDIKGFADIPHLNKIVEDMIHNSKDFYPPDMYKQMSEDSIKDALLASPRFTAMTKVKKLFGVPLKDLPMELPLIIERLIYFVESNYLTEEHIYLKNGDQSSIERMVKLLDSGASFSKLMAKDYGAAPYTICVVLNKFMIEMQNDFLGTTTYDFIKATQLEKEKDRFSSFKELINSLPQKNRNYLARFMKFFKRIISKSSQNKVIASSIGVIFAPALLHTTDTLILQSLPKVFEIMLTNANLYFPKTLYKDKSFRDASKEDYPIIERFNAYEEKLLLDAIKNKEIRVQIFSMSLKDLQSPIPIILQKFMCLIEKYYLTMEGLFRIPAQNSQMKKCIELIESGGSIKDILSNLNFNKWHTFCGVLKEFLRKIPEPIIELKDVDEYYEATCKITYLFNNHILVKKDGYVLKDVVDKNMSTEGKILLARFMRLFERIIEYTKINKMTSNSLAICLGMNLIHTSDAMQSLQISPKVNKIFEGIVDYSSIIFPLMNYKEAKFDDIYDPEFDEVSKLALLTDEADDEDDELIEYFNPLFDPESMVDDRDKSDWIRDSLFLDHDASSLEDQLTTLRKKISNYRQSNVHGMDLSDLQNSIKQNDEELIDDTVIANKTREFSIRGTESRSWEFDLTDEPAVTPVEGNDVFTAEEIIAHKTRSMSRRLKRNTPSVIKE